MFKAANTSRDNELKDTESVKIELQKGKHFLLFEAIKFPRNSL